MRIDAACPSCGSADLKIVPVIHHMLCAYVGPDYDFEADARGYRCPKCRRWLRHGVHDWEIVGGSAQCLRCGAEYAVAEEPSRCMEAKIVAHSPDADVLPFRRRSDARD